MNLSVVALTTTLTYQSKKRKKEKVLYFFSSSDRRNYSVEVDVLWIYYPSCSLACVAKHLIWPYWGLNLTSSLVLFQRKYLFIKNRNSVLDIRKISVKNWTTVGLQLMCAYVKGSSESCSYATKVYADSVYVVYSHFFKESDLKLLELKVLSKLWPLDVPHLHTYGFHR